MNSAALHFKKRIDAGSLTAWPTFVGFEPPKPDDCITLYDTQPLQDSPCCDWMRPSVLVRIRTKDYAAGYALGIELRKFFCARFDAGSWSYTAIDVFTDLTSIGQDENKRFVFTIQFNTMVSIHTQSVLGVLYNPWVALIDGWQENLTGAWQEVTIKADVITSSSGEKLWGASLGGEIKSRHGNVVANEAFGGFTGTAGVTDGVVVYLYSSLGLHDGVPKWSQLRLGIRGGNYHVNPFRSTPLAHISGAVNSSFYAVTKEWAADGVRESAGDFNTLLPESTLVAGQAITLSYNLKSKINQN